ncbi:MAG: hypothetical protein NVS3B20_15950 [Polyangiales bacterium]
MLGHPERSVGPRSHSRTVRTIVRTVRTVRTIVRTTIRAVMQVRLDEVHASLP